MKLDVEKRRKSIEPNSEVDEDQNTPVSALKLKKPKKKKLKPEPPSEDSTTPAPPQNGTSPKKPKKNKRKANGTTEPVITEKKPKIAEPPNPTPPAPESPPADNDSDSEESPQKTNKKPPKDASKFTAKFLRTSLNSASGLDSLRKFVSICTDTNSELADDYLLAGGSVLEILRLLDTNEKKNLNNVTTVFSALHIVIIKILKEYPQYQSRAEEACRHFINSHLSSVHSMLSNQSNAKQRKIVLRLLASMVSLGGNIPRELLAHLSFHQQTLDLLSQQTKPTDPQSIRTCFIHFILSFLIDTSVPIIRTLLDKRGMLSSIFPDLIYDSHETVHLVLTTVKRYVLEQPGITKTSKLHVFSTPVLQALVSLYNWKGPRNWPGFKYKAKGTTDHEVNQEDKAIAVDALHEFLLVLLTSNKHGVIFNDKSLGTSGKKNNQLVNTILQSLDRPWEHEKPCELVSKILAACPDLIRSQLTYTEAFLEPRPTKKWGLVMKFVRSIVVNINPNILKPSLTELSLSQLISATLTLGMPLVVLKTAVVPSVNAGSIVLRHEAVLTLIVMLKKMKGLLDVTEENLPSSSDFLQFKSAIKEYILKNMPSVGGILKTWSQAGEPEGCSEETTDLAPSKSSHYAAILDLLDAYHQVCPEFLDAGLISDPELEPRILLKFTGDDGDQVDELELNKMKLQAVKIILLLDSTTFELQDKLFNETILFLVSILNHESVELRSEADKIMKMLLASSELFEGCDEQIDIWLNCFGMFEAEERDAVANWLIKIIKITKKKKEKYLNMIIDAEEKSGDQIVSLNKIKDIFNELMDKDSSTESLKISKMQGSTSIPTILCSALDNLKKKPEEIVFKYMSFVAVFTLHCQIAPGALISLCQDGGLPEYYLNSWKNGAAPVPIDQPLAENNVLKFSKILMSSDAIDFAKIFQETGGVKTKQEVLDLLRMILFYAIQFIQRGDVSPDGFNCFKSIILFVLDHSKKMEAEEDGTIVLQCSQMILKNPLILLNFSPVPMIASDLEVTITHGLVDVFKKITDVNDENVLPELFLPYRNKLLTQLRTIINKTVAGGRRLMKSRCLLELVGIFQLEEEEIFDLLKGILSLYKETFVTKEKNCLSVMGQLIGKLVELLADTKIIDPIREINLIHKVCIYLSQLKVNEEIDFSTWELGLLKFFSNYPGSITKIDAKIFTSLLENKINPSTAELISFLTGKNEKFISLFVDFSESNESIMNNSDLIFSVLASNTSHKWKKSFLKKVYKTYKSGIKNYFLCSEQAPAWIQKNPATIGFLINKSIKLQTCQEISQAILSSGDKLETVDLIYVKLLQNLYEKYSKLSDNPEEILTTLLQILLKISVSTLKKDAKNAEKLQVVCDNLCSTINLLKSSNNNFTFETLNQHHLWPQFTRFSLKLGLTTLKKEKKVNDVKNSLQDVPLLKSLSKMCDIAYQDKTENEYVKTLFEMTTSHSEFINLMLSNQKIKTDLLELLYILVRKNHSIMGSIQLPLYLSAYNATLNESDQWIVKILQHYEAENIKFNDYKPYLFGEAAASHYSVKGEADTALWRQPSTSQVLELFNIEIVTKTIENYPVKRGLKVDGIHEESGVYDPAFYLPLFNHLLGDSNVVACHKVTQTGALALAFAACGSECSDVRMAAFTVITRFYHHLEGASSKEKFLWIRLVDSMRNAISSLECELGKVRMSCLVTGFFARASMILTQPGHPLYAALNKFFMAKAAVGLDCIPEFLTLFHSSDIQHKIHRHWILEVIRDGMKTEVDMEVALKCVLFKIIFSFYNSILADPETKKLILQVIAASVKIPKAALMLSRGYGLQVWLDEAGKNLDPRDAESKNLISSISALIA